MKVDPTAGWATSWLQQCLLRRAPQDDPYSPVVLAAAVLAYALVDVMQARTASAWPVALGMSITDTLIVIVFTWLVLLVTGQPARLVQTLTALAGTGTLLGLLGMPLMLQASRVQQSGEPGAALDAAVACERADWQALEEGPIEPERLQLSYQHVE